jgi:uncharacterized protein YndB with AHSA1/START domain
MSTALPLDQASPAPLPDLPIGSGVGPITESMVVHASAGRVWRAVADPDARLRWWSYLVLEAVVGSRWEEHWTLDGARRVTSGTVLVAHPRELLRLSWADDDWPATTEVDLTLEDRGARTTVRVVHRGWQALPEGAALRRAHVAGWRHHLRNLRAALER